MFGARRLMESNCKALPPKRIPMRNKRFEFIYANKTLDMAGISRILRFFASIKAKFHNAHIPLHFNMGKVQSADKLTITLLECIMYALIAELQYDVTLDFRVERTIFTECMLHSPLRYLRNSKQDERAKFCSEFVSHISMQHFRKLVPEEAVYDERLSVITSDMRHFLFHNMIDEDYCDRISEVVSELLNNAAEHGQTSCLVDIDVSQEYSKYGSEGAYHGINISLVSFSDIGFEESLRTKLSDETCCTGRYRIVADAYQQHHAFFNDDYHPEDFFRVAAFQDKISGRVGETASGGTGLTRLLQSVETLSDADICYLLTSNRMMLLQRDLLDYDPEGWIGFNSQKSFFNYPPESNILLVVPFVFPGVAYNLNFAYKKGE